MNPHSIRHCFFNWIYKTWHILFTWIGCIQGTPLILFSRHFLFTIDEPEYTSPYIYLSYFEVKYTWCTLESLHIAAYLLKVNLGPLLCYVRYMLTLNPAKWTSKAKIVLPDSVSFINSKWVDTLY